MTSTHETLSRMNTRRMTVADVQALHPRLPRVLARWLLAGDSYRRNEDGTYTFISGGM